MDFEGDEIDGHRVVIRRFQGDVNHDMPVGSEWVMCLRAKVVGVSHVINQKTGHLVRVHDLKITDIEEDHD